LDALEQEELDDRLAGAERAPVHAPTSPVGVTSGRERERNYASLDCRTPQLIQQVSRSKPRKTTKKRNYVNYKRSWRCRMVSEILTILYYTRLPVQAQFPITHAHVNSQLPPRFLGFISQIRPASAFDFSSIPVCTVCIIGSRIDMENHCLDSFPTQWLATGPSTILRGLALQTLHFRAVIQSKLTIVV
jgi:hypothetical protein